MLKATEFRVTNYRNIDDSGWIPLEDITAFVGRNESGKTALLKALHKFNPATAEPYDSQREFPRDRYTRDFKDGGEWPVCSVVFSIDESLKNTIESIDSNIQSPTKVTCTKFYDGSLEIECEPAIKDEEIDPKTTIEALEQCAADARRLESPTPEQEEETNNFRSKISNWADERKIKLGELSDLKTPEAIAFLDVIRKESNGLSGPISANVIEVFQKKMDPVIAAAKKPSNVEQVNNLLKENLPVFIYFDDYGILDSAIYLPHFLDELSSTPNNSRIRTINAMFKHVNLKPEEINKLGAEIAQTARGEGRKPTPEEVGEDQKKKEARAIKLNSASLDITKRFNEWYGQRRHKISYQADGSYFRIWVSDDRRPGVEIELEGRSKGFQWFFSFYLVFLVESEGFHKDAMLLLDEPGLHLHPTAQQELINFFKNLATTNQLIYTTHSPFLIDGENLHKVRPVTEDQSGHSKISVGEWPKDRETIFPLRAAAGYAIMKELFRQKKNVLVEGMGDYYYFHALNEQCAKAGLTTLADDTYITPCGGTKHVGMLASLFLGQEIRPIILLDGDDAGRARRDSLLKELYASNEQSIIMLDELLEKTGGNAEIEDILDIKLITDALSNVIGRGVTIPYNEQSPYSLPEQVEAECDKKSIELPGPWKAMVAINIVTSVGRGEVEISREILDRASKLFSHINERFEQAK